jgi:hypothetical protein
MSNNIFFSLSKDACGVLSAFLLQQRSVFFFQNIKQKNPVNMISTKSVSCTKIFKQSLESWSDNESHPVFTIYTPNSCDNNVNNEDSASMITAKRNKELIDFSQKFDVNVRLVGLVLGNQSAFQFQYASVLVIAAPVLYVLSEFCQSLNTYTSINSTPDKLEKTELSYRLTVIPY